VAEAAAFKQDAGTFTPWTDIAADTDLMFYEGLHGAAVTDRIDIAKAAAGLAVPKSQGNIMATAVPVITATHSKNCTDPRLRNIRMPRTSRIPSTSSRAYLISSICFVFVV